MTPPAGRPGPRRGPPGPREQHGGGARRGIHPLGGDQVEGRRAVLELLTAGRRRVRRIRIADGQDPSPQLDEIERVAAHRRVPLETVPRARLDAEAKTFAPQGVLALAEPVGPVELARLASPKRGAPFLLVVAGVTDPQNLGALLRSAAGAGVSGVVLARHRAAHLSPSVVKVAAGAVEHLAFSVVGGIPAALEELRRAGLFTIGLAADGERSLYGLRIDDAPVALVVGGEERGLAPLVRRRCDEVVSIPQRGGVASLNVAAAGTVACFEMARRRAEAGVIGS
ncbi:MAG: TrmH family RNA methyltransferase [Acidimicrobiales bacterium]